MFANLGIENIWKGIIRNEETTFHSVNTLFTVVLLQISPTVIILL